MAQEIRKSLPLDVRAIVDECHKKEAVSKQHSHFAIESWQKQMNDSDLDVKEKVSLKDPYSAMRITKPAKGLPSKSILDSFSALLNDIVDQESDAYTNNVSI